MVFVCIEVTMKKVFPVFLIVTCLQFAGFKLTAQCGTVTDIDGNIYHTVKIGKQCWLQENLKTTHFNNGTAIAEIKDSTAWAKTFLHNTPAWCYLQNKDSNDIVYGKLYNWYATTNSPNVCPAGWHVPSIDDFEVLMDYLGGDSICGDHMKSLNLWPTTNSHSDNSSGFTALPGSSRNSFGDFYPVNDAGLFWSSNSSGTIDAWYYGLFFANPNAYKSSFNKANGMSVRCVAN